MPHAAAIGFGLMVGVLARTAMLRSDYRQYPSYPHGYTTHLFLGAIASLAGPVAIVALIEGQWTAVTFFLLVAEQFRGIRSMERDALKALEDDELVTRGSEYIENIARVFETRYYIVIFVSASATAGYEFQSLWAGLLFAFIAFGLGLALMQREQLGNTVEVEAAPVTVKGQDVWVRDIYIINVGLAESREIIEKYAIGAVLTPKNDTGRDTLANLGERQAILHDATAILGVRKEADTPEFTPLSKRDVKTGRVAVYFVPMEKDPDTLVRMLRKAPVLESARGRSLYARMGKKGLAGLSSPQPSSGGAGGAGQGQGDGSQGEK